ncbi:DUF1254 domain-containing protein [Pseudomonas sp.]|uniref:DUF1254 domain-containing protein n=1 Tax=Pseudomonas sp. TaxID=306 RepID=UPI00299D8573|nr:DUF1254 domain-containing protein [Pseudomonas sp.]MDX1370761.1 DUF1254 domain-containing protein [Pseudomonas sp.]
MKSFNTLTIIVCLTAAIAVGGFQNATAAEAEDQAVGLTPEEARAIAKEAYIYANPLVDNYRVLHDYFVDPENPDFKAPWNQIKPIPRVYTHEDRAVQTPNSDTPYAFLGLDLRTEPMVLTVPEIEEDRYFSIQLTDLYTHNFDYIGSRTTGNAGGNFMIAGPDWRGEAPDGIDRLFRSETELMLAIYRTQLFGPDDLEAVKAIQAGYKVQPLSAFLGQPAPEAAPAIDFIEPLTREEITQSPRVFQQLNYVLQFCPTHPSEKELMARFARLGIGAGKIFDWDAFSPDVQEAIGQGIADAWADFAALRERIDAGEVGSADAFGTREHLQNNYLFRMAGAVLGIWGTSAEENIFPSYAVDAEGQPLDGAHNYTLRFEPGQLPPARAFWSLTMYELPESLLVANPLDRYLLNSPMLDDFVRDDDGGITFYLQQESPGKELEPNWLPTPAGPFYAVMRIYWPKPEALDGTWKLPLLERVQ